jgi:DNA-binding HxlR family transcriptional regulator
VKLKTKENSPKPPVKGMVENIIRCKWSLSVIEMVRRGINRPGAMERHVDGLTAKVLNERLRKLVRFGIFHKHVYPESPPRVEYNLTEFGQQFLTVLDAIEELERDLMKKQ